MSYHAVARYVERILGVEIDIDEASLPPAAADRNRLIAQQYCDAVGQTIDAVRQAILTPGVQLAMEHGFCMVGTRDFVARIDPAKGLVTTITWPFHVLHAHRKARGYSRTESNRMDRRETLADRDRHRAARSAP